ncbi:XRE family transcriptional regulator [Herbaspirillum robiniae]|uniref:XRE family transcriptional regulator n=2 Tax=Herbaspirillum robiniae TaxID=2014887 RepID=A0A246WQ69_9BURK|nr:XRE family transcriptional regulator [Herbaspirillum robiniae]
MPRNMTPEELEVTLGENLQRYRLSLNLSQERVAYLAGINTRTLQNLEAGRGSSMRTFVMVLRALGRNEWLDTLAPSTFNPLTLPRDSDQRQRAFKARKKTAPTLGD